MFIKRKFRQVEFSDRINEIVEDYDSGEYTSHGKRLVFNKLSVWGNTYSLHQKNGYWAFQNGNYDTQYPGIVSRLNVIPGSTFEIELNACVNQKEGFDGRAYLYVGECIEGANLLWKCYSNEELENIRIPVGKPDFVGTRIKIPDNVNEINVGILFRGRCIGHAEVRASVHIHRISIKNIDSPEIKMESLVSDHEEIQDRKMAELENRMTKLCEDLQDRNESMQETYNDLIDAVKSRDNEIDLLNNIIIRQEQKINMIANFLFGEENRSINNLRGLLSNS